MEVNIEELVIKLSRPLQVSLSVELSNLPILMDCETSCQLYQHMVFDT